MSAVSVCVFCGSRGGTSPVFEAVARDTGQLIGRMGWQLVYGGGGAGLMGTVADAALAAGARVVGVIPQSLMSRELGHGGLTELHVVQSMHERKRLMAERSDVFLALPGGLGTLEEQFEVWTWRQLGYHDKPLGLLNTAGYYDGLLSFIDQGVVHGFVMPAQRALLEVNADVGALLPRLGYLTAASGMPDDYSRS